MLERLHFVALPHPEESPRSVLKRTAAANGFRSIPMLASHCTGVPERGLIGLLLGTAPLVGVLAQAVGDYRESFLGAFYRQLPGPTTRSPVLVAGTLISPSWLRTQTHRVCPGCAREGWLRVIHDLAFVEACPTHGCLMLSHCPRCAAPLRWGMAGIGQCPCGYDLASAQRTEVDCAGARRVLATLQAGATDAFRRLTEIPRILRFDRASTPEERNRLLNSAIAIGENQLGALLAVFEESRRTRPGLPARALAAPWLAARDEGLRSQMEVILDKASPDYPQACGTCDCASQRLSSPEIGALLGISSQGIAALVGAGFLKKNTNKQSWQVDYPLTPICQFLRSLAPASQSTGPAKACSPLASIGFDDALITKIQAIQNGTLKVVQVDGRQGLRNVRVEASQRPPNRMPAHCVGVTEAAQRLGTYPNALRRVIKAGLLGVAPHGRGGTTVFLRKTDVEAFDQRFVFVGAISQRIGRGRTVTSAKLAHLGIWPVSGPTVDGALVALYRRTDVDSLNFAQIAAMTTFSTRTGRKKGGPALYDKCQWMSSGIAAQTLGVSPQGLRALVVHGLLCEGVPPGRSADNRRYFTVPSVESAQQWLERARSWEQVAHKLGRSVPVLKLRFLRTGYVKPLKIGVRQWIGAADIERMRLHLKHFCSCAEADAWHRAPLKHFNNLVATGRFQPVFPEEAEGIDSVILLHWSAVRAMKRGSRLSSAISKPGIPSRTNKHRRGREG